MNYEIVDCLEWDMFNFKQACSNLIQEGFIPLGLPQRIDTDTGKSLRQAFWKPLDNTFNITHTENITR